jgi:hypothetical protein
MRKYVRTPLYAPVKGATGSAARDRRMMKMTMRMSLRTKKSTTMKVMRCSTMMIRTWTMV